MGPFEFESKRQAALGRGGPTVSGGRGAWPAVLEPAWVGGWEGLGCLTAGPASAARHAWPRCTSPSLGSPSGGLPGPSSRVKGRPRLPALPGCHSPRSLLPWSEGEDGGRQPGRPAHSGPPSLPLTADPPLDPLYREGREPCPLPQILAAAPSTCFPGGGRAPTPLGGAGGKRGLQASGGC